MTLAKELKIKPGVTVKAFHPQRFGVINEGIVQTVDHKLRFARVDFGQLLGGIYEVNFRDITEVVD